MWMQVFGRQQFHGIYQVYTDVWLTTVQFYGIGICQAYAGVWLQRMFQVDGGVWPTGFYWSSPVISA